MAAGEGGAKNEGATDTAAEIAAVIAAEGLSAKEESVTGGSCVTLVGEAVTSGCEARD
jgi:hypothetical protein